MFNNPTDDTVADGAPCLADNGFENSENSDWPADTASDATPTVSLTPTTPEMRERCAFFTIAHRMAHWMRREGRSVRLRDLPSPACRESRTVDFTRREDIRSMTNVVSASGGRVIMRFAQPNPRAPGQANFVVLARCPAEPGSPVLLEVVEPGAGADAAELVKATYLITLRSLDEMIYAMGVLLRADPEGDHLLLARSPNCLEIVRREQAGPRTYVDCVRAPLFELGRGTNPRDYAASVDYRGQRVFAGPPVQLPGDAGYDRTATVLTLLTQLFALATAPAERASSPTPAPVIVVN
jgi:hypothetical protein